MGLTDFLGKPLKEDLNADEAPAFGAAFRAANLSSTFRVRSVGMDDITPFAVGVKLKDLTVDEEGAVEGEKSFKKRGSLFSEKNHLFRRRAVTLKHAKDLRVELFYESQAPLPMNTSRELGVYEVTGIESAIKKYMEGETAEGEKKYNISELPKVSLSFLLDANGVVDLVAATASFTEWVTEEKVIKKDSKKEKKTDEDAETEADAEAESDEAKTDEGTESDSAEESKDDESAEADKEGDEEVNDEETEKVSRKRTHRVDLDAKRTRPLDVAAKTGDDFASAAKLLLELDDRDRRVIDTADARNALESYIFESRNRLYEDSDVSKVSTEEEREALREVLTLAEDWIWDVEEESAAIDAAGQTLGQLLDSVEMLRTNYSWVNATEIDRLENMTKKSEQWLNEKIEAQSEQSLLEKPLFLSHEVYYKVEPAVEYAKKLLSRPKPYGWGREKKKSKNGTDSKWYDKCD